MKGPLGAWLTLTFYGAVIYVLVRPGSSGPDAIKAFGQQMVSLVQTATAT